MAKVIYVKPHEVRAAQLLIALHEAHDRKTRQHWWQVWKPKPYLAELKNRDALKKIAEAKPMKKENDHG